MNQEQFIEKLKDKYSNEDYTVVYAGKNSYESSVIKCNICGKRIQINTGELLRNRRKHICSKCYYKRQNILKNEKIIENRLKNVASNIEFYTQERKGVRHSMVNFTCNKCGRINTKEVANFLNQKYNCGYCEGKKESKDMDMFLLELEEKAGKKFKLLTEYSNTKTPIKIRCNNCGFIREVKPNTLLSSCYCPKCDKKSSLGEKKISKYLNKNNIQYIPQMYFSNWKIGIHYFDFYIPEFNLVLEFNGIQHYSFNKYFHKTVEFFEQQKLKDKTKKEEAIKNGFNYVSINYKLVNVLDSVLEYIFNSTTIPSGSRGKCFEIETIQDIG